MWADISIAEDLPSMAVPFLASPPLHILGRVLCSLHIANADRSSNLATFSKLFPFCHFSQTLIFIITGLFVC